jgi:hypothetical protein
MANDSGLFRTAEQLQATGNERNGANWFLPMKEPSLSEKSEEGLQPLGRYVPLYEAKMVHQFDHRWATYVGDDVLNATLGEHSCPEFEPVPRYWVPEGEVLERLVSKGWDRSWIIGWRAISGVEKIRTVIAGIIPSVGCGHTFLLMLPNVRPRLAAVLYASINSIICDYVARQKVGGTALTNFVLEQLAVLPPEAYPEPALAFLVPRVLELIYTSHSMAPFAHDLGYDGPPFIWDEDRRALLRAELDSWYGRAYGLTRDELRYILDPADVMGLDYPSETFRVLKNSDIKRYGEYRTRRLVLSAWDRMECGELPAPEPYDQRTAAAQQLANTGEDYPAENPLFGAGPLFDHLDGSRS